MKQFDATLTTKNIYYIFLCTSKPLESERTKNLIDLSTENNDKLNYDNWIHKIY